MVAERPLEGKVAVVTGASGGLGAHFARVLAGRGARVALTARRTGRLDAEAEAIRSAGGEARAYGLDVADAAAIAPCFERVQAELGPISILINNAGVGGEGRALDLTPEESGTPPRTRTHAAAFFSHPLLCVSLLRAQYTGGARQNLGGARAQGSGPHARAPRSCARTCARTASHVCSPWRSTTSPESFVSAIS